MIAHPIWRRMLLRDSQLSWLGIVFSEMQARFLATLAPKGIVASPVLTQLRVFLRGRSTWRCAGVLMDLLLISGSSQTATVFTLCAQKGKGPTTVDFFIGHRMRPLIFSASHLCGRKWRHY